MKDKKKTLVKLPKISRFFTELQKGLIGNKQRSNFLKKYFVFLSIAVLFVFIVFMFFDLRQKILLIDVMDQQKKQIVKEIKEWEAIILKHDDYKDVYLQLAILEYRIGNVKKAKEYLKKVFELDQNSREGRDLEKIIGDNY